MLLHLSIRDFAIVDPWELEFRGFYGADRRNWRGKINLIDALSMTLGDRTGGEPVVPGRSAT